MCETRLLTAGAAAVPPKAFRTTSTICHPMYSPAASARQCGAGSRGCTAEPRCGCRRHKLFMVTSPAHDVFKSMSPEVARAAAEQTHRGGKLVLAHPSTVGGIRNALDVGVDILVHTTLGERVPWDEELVKRMVAQNMSVMPTFKLWGYELQKGQVPAEVVERLYRARRVQVRARRWTGLFGPSGLLFRTTHEEYLRCPGRLRPWNPPSLPQRRRALEGIRQAWRRARLERISGARGGSGRGRAEFRKVHAYPRGACRLPAQFRRARELMRRPAGRSPDPRSRRILASDTAAGGCCPAGPPATRNHRNSPGGYTRDARRRSPSSVTTNSWTTAVTAPM